MFPATVSTIARTAFKIPKRLTGDSSCCLCYGPVDELDEFTKLMQRVDGVDINDKNDTDTCLVTGGCCSNNADCCSTPMQIDILPLMCYACRNIYKVDAQSIPQFAYENARKTQTRISMKQTIDEFLIADEE